MAACGTCGGSGRIYVEIVSPPPKHGEWQTCPTCNGTGTK
jgi:DnaJ-class molecular chaperone